ncbi:hypothetical protein BIV57_08425, partial [Mangrovactinospora gilvigrisea]
MSAEFDSLNNRGEYFAAHYFAEQLGADLKKGLLATWTMRERDEHDARETPRQLLRALRAGYLTDEARGYFAEQDQRDREADTDGPQLHTYDNAEWCKRLTEWHQQVLAALGFQVAAPGELTVHRAGRQHAVQVAFEGEGIIALDCGWAKDSDSAIDGDGPGRLIAPCQISGSETIRSGAALAEWLFHSNLGDEKGPQPRFVLLLVGGVVVLADRNHWGEGRYLAANLDAALERNDRAQGGELATIAALFSREMLTPGENGEAPPIDALLKASTDNAVGVSGELRHGLQRSVEIIANEVLARLDETGLTPPDIEDPAVPIAKELTRESLRYLYRILFLLYAEARPELQILPADDGSYEAGYSMARLRELVARDEQLTEERAKNGFHLFASLDVLFNKVNFGHRIRGTEPDDDLPGDDEETRKAKAARRSGDKGLRFEALHSKLFEPGAIRLIGRQIADPRIDEDDPDADAGPELLDLRLRNEALHEVLRLLTMKKAAKRGQRGGFISYRNLGINQLGAVYEGLMAYTGFIADAELCEVAKNGNPEGGSWMIPSSKQKDYPDEVFVEYGEEDRRKGLRGRKKYPPGSFVYRLAGRDRQTSASYYTPESLTKVTVELALKYRLDQEKDEAGNTIKTRATELLQWKICEPALGSGAFLNEAINQLAEEYLRRRQEELKTSIPTADVLDEKRKVKAYIALHNAYGVDLNDTAVELAEVSLWLNTMHPGMQAPWFGLHLRRGNSLIGARRAVYAGKDVVAKDKAWLKTNKDALPPTELPFLRDGERQDLPKGAIHQFLLPAVGWGAVASAKEAKELAPEETAQLAKWRRGILKPPSGERKGGRRSELERLQAVARRAELLWELVVRRMELSEREISRHIEVWGAGKDDPEYAFLRRPESVVKKEKVYRDLFEKQGTPYWRLKTVMNAWCALWFWPVDKAGLVDGTAADYDPEEEVVVTAALEALPHVGEIPQQRAAPVVETQEVEPAAPAPAALRFSEQISIFALGDEQPALDEGLATEPPAAPTRTKGRKPAPRIPARARHIPMRSMADWLDFAEATLGTFGERDNLFEVGTFSSLDDLDTYEESLPALMGMDAAESLAFRFPWLHEVADIAGEQGFLHWELDFALVFAGPGGFDLQIGNPPWVRPDWNETSVLAELEPWFALRTKLSAQDRSRRSDRLLTERGARAYLLVELANTSATSTFLASKQTYPLLAGTRPDFYRAFMTCTWRHTSRNGAAGLLHPDTHFNGDKEAALRAAAYRRLRVHGDFVNSGQRFFPRPIGDTSHFGVHIYGNEKETGFQHLSWLVSADALRLSPTHNGAGDIPGIRYKNGEFDERPHRSRVVWVDDAQLAVWQRLLDEEGSPLEQARLLFPVSTAEEQAIRALADYPVRLRSLSPQITRGFDESGAKEERLIDYNRSEGDSGEYQPRTWREVILKGTQLSVATPIFKRHDANSNDPYGRDLASLPSDFVADTAYVRIADPARFRSEQDRWLDHRSLTWARNSDTAIARARSYLAEKVGLDEDEVPHKEIDALFTRLARRRYATFPRLAWRCMIAPNTERALYAAVIPAGPTHVDATQSLIMQTLADTILVAGFWASLPMDYYLRVTGRSHLRQA